MEPWLRALESRFPTLHHYLPTTTRVFVKFSTSTWRPMRLEIWMPMVEIGRGHVHVLIRILVQLPPAATIVDAVGPCASCVHYKPTYLNGTRAVVLLTNKRLFSIINADAMIASHIATNLYPAILVTWLWMMRTVIVALAMRGIVDSTIVPIWIRVETLTPVVASMIFMAILPFMSFLVPVLQATAVFPCDSFHLVLAVSRFLCSSSMIVGLRSIETHQMLMVFCFLITLSSLVYILFGSMLYVWCCIYMLELANERWFLFEIGDVSSFSHPCQKIATSPLPSFFSCYSLAPTRERFWSREPYLFLISVNSSWFKDLVWKWMW